MGEDDRMKSAPSPAGLHRVVHPAGVLPQAAEVLDARPELWPGEVRVEVERLNLDAASYRQLHGKHAGDGEAIRAEVLCIVEARGKMHNPVTGSGGMLIGTVTEVAPGSPLGLEPGDRIATLVSLTLTPLAIAGGLAGWDGLGEQVPAAGHAILFERSAAAKLPADLPAELALAVLDVCGAPALTARVTGEYLKRGTAPRVAVIGAAGKSGSLSLAAARLAGASHTTGVVPTAAEAERLRTAGLASAVVMCVVVPGCEHGAILATAQGGTVVFFSMATSFTAAALGAEGLAADVTMLIGNGFVPGHAGYALDLLRSEPGVRQLFAARLAAER
jgi:L-erythro-3,5-diaminohexanoate dehydrogenase